MTVLMAAMATIRCGAAAGNDMIDGGAGNDVLQGGDGIDTVVDTSGGNVYLDLVPNAVSPVWTLWVDEMTDIENLLSGVGMIP